KRQGQAHARGLGTRGRRVRGEPSRGPLPRFPRRGEGRELRGDALRGGRQGRRVRARERLGRRPRGSRREARHPSLARARGRSLGAAGGQGKRRMMKSRLALWLVIPALLLAGGLLRGFWLQATSTGSAEARLTAAAATLDRELASRVAAAARYALALRDHGPGADDDL